MPYKCDAGEGQPVWRASGALSAVRTTLVFDGMRVPLEQGLVAASAGRFATPRIGVTLAAAGLVDGSIDDRDLGPGGGASIGVSWLARREYKGEPLPFLLVSGSFAGAAAPGYAALDGRVGVSFGWTLGQRVTAYGAARAFGGPVWWRRDGERLTGSDRYHVTAGAGATLRFPGVLDVGLEAMPLGEQSATASVTIYF